MLRNLGQLFAFGHRISRIKKKRVIASNTQFVQFIIFTSFHYARNENICRMKLIASYRNVVHLLPLSPSLRCDWLSARQTSKLSVRKTNERKKEKYFISCLVGLVRFNFIFGEIQIWMLNCYSKMVTKSTIFGQNAHKSSWHKTSRHRECSAQISNRKMISFSLRK